MPVKKTSVTVKPKLKKTGNKLKSNLSDTTKIAKKNVFETTLFNIRGEKIGVQVLTKTVFGLSAKPELLTQALRVHRINMRQGTQSTKTRGQVTGSTRKIYRQKGTGRARHGSITAPIFVGGGVVFGPHPRNFVAKLPQKMRRKALYGSLTQKVRDNSISVVGGLTEISGKTKDVAGLLKAMGILGKRLLLVLTPELKLSAKGARNIDRVTVKPLQDLSAVDILENDHIIFAQEAINELSLKIDS